MSGMRRQCIRREWRLWGDGLARPVACAGVHIVVNLVTGDVTLTDPDDFTGFDMRLVGSADQRRLGEIVGTAKLGYLLYGGTHVAVDPMGLRSLAGPLATDSWEAGFSAMCDYAATKGWLGADGTVRAHVERPSG
jgi:hypothetical protein